MMGVAQLRTAAPTGDNLVVAVVPGVLDMISDVFLLLLELILYVVCLLV